MEQAIQLALDIIKETDSNNYDEILRIFQGNQTGSFCNMFIMKKEMFFEYCSWIFPILFKLDRQLGRNYQAGQERCIGWTAEMLTSAFTYLKSKQCSHKQVLFFYSSSKSNKGFCKNLMHRIKSYCHRGYKQKLYLNSVYNYQLFKRYCLK